MELVMLGSNAFAHIVEALILWMGMSQMYEARYKQVVTGLVIMVGHAIMFWVFLTGNIYVVTIVNNLIYILLIALLYNVSKRSAIFWAVIYNAMMAISELIMFFTARYIVGIENAGRKDTVDIIFMFCLCNISYFLITQTMVFIKKKSIAFDKNDMSKILLMGSLTTSLIVFMTYYIIGTTWNLHQKETIWMMISSVGLESSPNLCVNSSFSYVVLSTLLLSSKDLTEWSLVYHSTLSYQRFYDLHSIHYDHLEGLHQLI